MIEYLACIIKDGMTDADIYQTIRDSSAYYVLDARTSPDKPLDLIYNEQRKRQNIFKGIPQAVPEGRGRPKPIKI